MLVRFFCAAILTLGLSSTALAKKSVAKPASPESATLKVDAEKSHVGWMGKKVLVDSSHNGTLKVKSGEIEIKDRQIAKGRFVIDMNTISNDDIKDDPGSKAKLEGHLKSPDFFDVKKFPEAVFEITSAKAMTKPAQGGHTHEVTGNLTMKGITHPVTFPATIAINDASATGKATFNIDRAKWDVRFASGKFFKSLGDKVIADEIEISLDLVATK